MSKSLLDTITYPSDLRKLKTDLLPQLARELRRFIIDVIATKEGHLGASLGVVEITIALHYFFNTPDDLLVWDVGHQAYGHKILTGRKNSFHTNRQLHGISGFPKRSESEFDVFGTGHSSTSISAALGMAVASSLKGETEKQHIVVIGDASIASGMAFEALNHAGVSNANLLIVLNDNAIGIDPSVGALKEYLAKIKTDKTVAKNNPISALNFGYAGPVDGHNMDKLGAELKRLKKIKGLRFLHVVTTKGKGLQKAEENQIQYHSPGKFDKISGEIVVESKEDHFTKYQDVFGKTLVELAKENEKIIAITPAMLTGSSLNLMMRKFPERTFDVGIAEQHAVTLAAGFATRKMVPFCVIYSTFLQRAYDQVIHDVALQNLPVIFCIDRAGLVGRDGATHHGVFDIAYLNCIPNLIICAPRNEIEFRNILYTSQLGIDHPIAIRYPRGKGDIKNWRQPFKKIKTGTGVCLKEGRKAAVLSVGTISKNITQAFDLLDSNIDIAHYDLRFIKPLDEALLHDIFKKFEILITIEDGVMKGGFGSSVLAFASQHKYDASIDILGIPDVFVAHGTIYELQKILGLDPQAIAKKLQKIVSR
ncbi:MAG: 1-deoxy-D-xylulose-5-phosphate synthase [Flavobacteriaceae bacterium]|nr:MAG: 1-deoxy-D-xylulose-5-phosphate synthase [Flavobacteriaceae bacterium]